jgi:Fic family protein
VALRTGVVGKEKDIQQVLNWLNANRLAEQVAYLTSKFKQSDIGIKELTQINALLGEKLIGHTELGKYRNGESGSEIEIESPPAVEVPYQTDDLFMWFKSASRNEIHPVLKVGVMFYELMRISPFADNNLQTCMDFFGLILASEGYGQKQMLAVEEELFKNKDNFYRVLSEVGGGLGDLTEWLEYMTKEVFDASEKTKIKVMNLVGDAPIFKSESGRVISLTERQIVIMEEMTVKNEMTIREIRSLLPMVSDDTILRDLKDLIDKKLIKKKGKTKGAIYLLGKVKGFR